MIIEVLFSGGRLVLSFSNVDRLTEHLFCYTCLICLIECFILRILLSGRLPHKYKVVIAGNHDLSFDEKLLAEDPTLKSRFNIDQEQVGHWAYWVLGISLI